MKLLPFSLSIESSWNVWGITNPFFGTKTQSPRTCVFWITFLLAGLVIWLIFLDLLPTVLNVIAEKFYITFLQSCKRGLGLEKTIALLRLLNIISLSCNFSQLTLCKNCFYNSCQLYIWLRNVYCLGILRKKWKDRY